MIDESTALSRAFEIALDAYYEKTGKDLRTENPTPKSESPEKNPPEERLRIAAPERGYPQSVRS